MKIAAMFCWLAVPMAAYLAYAAFGLPHVIWNYSFHNNGDPHNLLKERHHTQCTFAGPYGIFTIGADAGQCGWIKFFQSGAAQ